MSDYSKRFPKGATGMVIIHRGRRVTLNSLQRDSLGKELVSLSPKQRSRPKFIEAAVARVLAAVRG